LNKDSAGMATNAEDFTKQFMSQMFGKETTSATPGKQKTPFQSFALTLLSLILVSRNT